MTHDLSAQVLPEVTHMLSIRRKTVFYTLWIVLSLGATIYCAATKFPGEMVLCLITWAISTGMMGMVLMISGRYSKPVAMNENLLEPAS